MSNVLESIVGTLPAKAQPYAKTYAAAVVASLNAVVLLVDVPDWVHVVIAVATAPVVFAVPNLDPKAAHQDESVQPPEFDPSQPFPGYGSGV